MRAIAGKFTFFRQVKAKNRWKHPEIPAYDLSWYVSFSMPGQSREVRPRNHLPICDTCMAHVGNPALERPGCSCVRAVKEWAKEELLTRTLLMQQGKIKELQEMRAPRKLDTPQRVLEVYKERGPKDKLQRLNSLKYIFEQTTGRLIGGMEWKDLTEDLVRDWAELRQEAGRRGWLGANGQRLMPEDGWAELRALKAEGRLPALDRRTAMPCNTSILGSLTQAKTIFGQEARSNCLRGLHLPDLEKFLGASLKLVKPKGHKKIDAARWVEMLEAEDQLKLDDLPVWVVHELLLRLSCRPKEIRLARPSWLEKVEHQGKMRTRIMIVNRPDEGFVLKAGEEAAERAIWLPDALVAAIEQVATPTSLIGAKHVTEAIEIIGRHSKWMRKYVPKGSSQTNYLLRHSGAAERMTSADSTKASALLGHKTTQMVETTYGAVLTTLEPISDDEILRRVA